MINFGVRFKNKTFIIALVAAFLSFVYYVLDMFSVVPRFTQNQIVEGVNLLLEVLALCGVIVDPTVEGVYDSSRALSYSEPAANCMQEKNIK